MTVLAREQPRPLYPGRLEVVDGAGAQLDRERDGAALGELVAVEPQGETGVAAGGEITPCLCRIEGTSLEEHVGGIGNFGGRGQHLLEGEVEIGVRAVELGRDRMSAEPGRRASRRADRTEGRKLGLAVEAIA